VIIPEIKKRITGQKNQASRLAKSIAAIPAESIPLIGIGIHILSTLETVLAVRSKQYYQQKHHDGNAARKFINTLLR
jgi:hypothetical protein